MTRHLWLGAAATLLVVSTGPAWGQTARALSGKEIYNRTLLATVWINPFEEQGNTRVTRSSGSGALIDAGNNLVLTNYHVVRDYPVVMVFFPAMRDKQPIAERRHYIDNFQQLAVDGKVVAVDKAKDLALIQLPGVPRGVRPLRLATEGAGPGDQVHSIGNPGASGALWAYTPGSVKAVYQKEYRSRGGDGTVLDINARVVETTSPVNPGDSGGPLVNERAELVGVTQGGIFGSDTRAISYFIDVSEVRGLLKSKRIRFNSGAAPVATAVSAPTTPSEQPSSTADTADKDEAIAAGKLALAKDLLSVSSKKDKALERLEEIVKRYPKTEAAAEAKDLIKKHQ